jgi:hypothetical protein
MSLFASNHLLTVDDIARASADAAALLHRLGNQALIYTASERYEVVRLADLACKFVKKMGVFNKPCKHFTVADTYHSHE